LSSATPTRATPGLHGSRIIRERPALGDRGDGHRGAGHRRQPGFVLHPSRSTRSPVSGSPGAGAGAGEYGLLGPPHPRDEFDFYISVVQGAGAFVCGESTGCMASLEGKVGEPRRQKNKYIHTVEYGYKNLPTNLNNVESGPTCHSSSTAARLVHAMGRATSARPLERQLGHESVLAGGQGQHTGLIEVRMGISLARDHLRHRGGIPRTRVQGRADRRAPAAACPRRTSTCRSTATASPRGVDDGIGRHDRDGRPDVHGRRRRYFIAFLTGSPAASASPAREGLRCSLERADAHHRRARRGGDIAAARGDGRRDAGRCLCAWLVAPNR